MRALKESFDEYKSPVAQLPHQSSSLSEDIAKGIAQRLSVDRDDFIKEKLKERAVDQTLTDQMYLDLWNTCVKEEKRYPSFYAFYHAQGGKAMFFNDVIILLKRELDIIPTTSIMRLQTSPFSYKTASDWAEKSLNQAISDRMTKTVDHFLSATLGLIGEEIFYNENPIYYLNTNTNMNEKDTFYQKKFVDLLQNLGFSDTTAHSLADDFIAFFCSHSSQLKGVLRQIFVQQDHLDELVYLSSPGHGAGIPIFKGPLKEFFGLLKNNSDPFVMARKMQEDFPEDIINGYNYESNFKKYNFQVRLYLTHPLFFNPQIVHTVAHLAPGSNHDAYSRYQQGLKEKIDELLKQYIHISEDKTGVLKMRFKNLQKYKEKRQAVVEYLGFERRIMDLSVTTHDVISQKKPVHEYRGALKMALREIQDLVAPQLALKQDSKTKEKVIRHLYHLITKVNMFSSHEPKLYNENPPRSLLDTLNNLIAALYYLAEHVIHHPSIDADSQPLPSIKGIKTILSTIEDNAMSVEDLQETVKRLASLHLVKDN